MTDLSTKLAEKNPKFSLIISTLIIVVGCVLLIAGFVVPPTGEIHSSVLVAFGEVMTFAGSLLGMRWYYRYRRPKS